MDTRGESDQLHYRCQRRSPSATISVLRRPMNAMIFPMIVGKLVGITAIGVAMLLVPKMKTAGACQQRSGGALVNTRQLLSVDADIGATTRVIFSHLGLVNRAAVSRECRVMNSSNATLAGKARSSLRRLISRRLKRPSLRR